MGEKKTYSLLGTDLLHSRPARNELRKNFCLGDTYIRWRSRVYVSTEAALRIAARTLLIASTLATILFYAISKPFPDFIVYWSAAHLFISGNDPYSLRSVFEFQQNMGFRGDVPLMMLSPPWTLAVSAPLGFLHSYVIAWLVMIAILIGSVAVASKLLMDLYFGTIQIPEISYPASYRCLFAFTFYPTLLALKMTQVSPLLLLGSAGFVYFRSRNRSGIAGLLLSLTLFKPHLFLLIWLALLLKREWTMIVSAIAPVLLLSAAVIARDPGVLHSYRNLMSGPFPSIALSGVLSWVRQLLGPRDTLWIQFVPPFFGLLWFGWYWRKHRKNWDWKDRMPVLLTASVIAAPYGYVHDQTLFMVPIIYLAAKSAEQCGKIDFNLVVAYTILNVAILAIAIISTPWCVLPGAIGISAALMFFIPRNHSWPIRLPDLTNPARTLAPKCK